MRPNPIDKSPFKHHSWVLNAIKNHWQWLAWSACYEHIRIWLTSFSAFMLEQSFMCDVFHDRYFLLWSCISSCQWLLWCLVDMCGSCGACNTKSRVMQTQMSWYVMTSTHEGIRVTLSTCDIHRRYDLPVFYYLGMLRSLSCIRNKITTSITAWRPIHSKE